MRLYYAPGACSMAPHIVLCEAGYSFELARVDIGKRHTADGEDQAKINPDGYVPALQLHDGQIRAEAAVIVQFLADHKPAARPAPVSETVARYRLMEWLNSLTAELRKRRGPPFNPDITPEWKDNRLNILAERFDYPAKHLGATRCLMGDHITIADAGPFTLPN